MACEELDSFYRKFKTLHIAAHNATHTLEGIAGEATVTLKTTLGSALPSSNCNSVKGKSRVKQHRSSSYYRRQQR